MLSYILFKFIADLSSFYGLFGCILGGAGFKPLYGALCLLIQCSAVITSYLFRNNKILSKLSLIILVAAYFLPMGACNIVLCSLSNIYIVVSILKQLFFPDWEGRSKILKLTAGLSVALTALISALGASAYVKSTFAPFIILSLACNAIITRSLRHDSNVYLSKKYQIVNVAGLCAAVLAALLLSSKQFINFAIRIAKLIYGKVLIKIIVLILKVIIWVIQIVVKAFSFLGGLFSGQAAKTEVPEINLDAMDIAESLGASEAVEGSAVIDYIIYAFLGLIGLFLAYKLLKSMLGNKKPETGNFKAVLERKPANISKEIKTEFENDNAEKVRKSYKAFLKYYVKVGLPLKKSSTSYDIKHFGKGFFGEDKPEQLRSIYLRARYKGEATKEDAASAKNLAKELCKTEQKI